MSATAMAVGLLAASVGIAGASASRATSADRLVTVTPSAIATTSSTVDQLLEAHGISPAAFAATFGTGSGIRINAAGLQLYSTKHGHVLRHLSWAQVAQAVSAHTA